MASTFITGFLQTHSTGAGESVVTKARHLCLK